MGRTGSVWWQKRPWRHENGSPRTRGKPRKSTAGTGGPATPLPPRTACTAPPAAPRPRWPSAPRPRNPAPSWGAGRTPPGGCHCAPRRCPLTRRWPQRPGFAAAALRVESRQNGLGRRNVGRRRSPRGSPVRKSCKRKHSTPGTRGPALRGAAHRGHRTPISPAPPRSCPAARARRPWAPRASAPRIPARVPGRPRRPAPPCSVRRLRWTQLSGGCARR
mmetsp:Transcript_51768/g.136885  ORF Transcript_51768/g.136885 Transcript_51768/m.136885 type:complete len:219 (+) Transcript_51768:372-1028(+)